MTKIVKAIKNGFVHARKANWGEHVTTVTAEGVETKNVTALGDMVVTATDKMGTPVLKNGHPNIWVVKENVFNEKYTRVTSDIYRPKGNEQSFMVLDHDVEFLAPWGETQRIKKGGVINISRFDDMYGIGKEEFKDTYSILEEKEF